MGNKSTLRRGPRPSVEGFPSLIRKELAIKRDEGYRVVRDPRGDRVRINLDRVVDHVALQLDDAGQPKPKGKFDPMRYRWIPRIFDTLKHPTEIYQGQPAGKGRRRTYIGAPEKAADRDVLLYPIVTARQATAAEMQQQRNEKTAGRTTDWSFFTVFPREEGRPLERIKETAGQKIYPAIRQNPAFVGPREPGEAEQAAYCLSGAAPALTSEYSRSSARESLLVLGALAGVLYLANRAKAA